VDAVPAVRVSGVVSDEVVVIAGIKQAYATVVVARRDVTSDAVVARIIQIDAVVVVRCCVTSDVVVARIIQPNAIVVVRCCVASVMSTFKCWIKSR